MKQASSITERQFHFIMDASDRKLKTTLAQ